MEAKAKTTEEDLSMEDILQSIRKIIADDDDPAQPSAKNSDADLNSAGGVDGAESTGSDVLELTDIVTEQISDPAADSDIADDSKKNHSNQNNTNDILSKIDQVVMPEQAVSNNSHAVATASASPIQDGQSYIDSLLSNDTAIAAANAFRRALPMDEPIRTSPSAHFRSGNSVEDLVMESLRPMLKSWLDANLPTIVEKLVEREVRKLAH